MRACATPSAPRDAADLLCVLLCSLSKDDMHSRNSGEGGMLYHTPRQAAPSPSTLHHPCSIHPDRAWRHDQTHTRTSCNRSIDVTLPRSRAELGTAASMGGSWGARQSFGYNG